MKARLLRSIASGLALAVALAGCGSDDGGSSGNAGGGGAQSGGGSGGIASGGSAGSGLDGGSDAAGDAPIDYGPYPAGPYGNEVGDTIANLAWEGYVNPSGAVASDTLPYGDYSTDEMRKSGKAYGLIHISAFT